MIYSYLDSSDRPLHTGGRARSSAGEHSLHTGGVTGSIPVAPTMEIKDLGSFTDFFVTEMDR
jgi:hypothetical protein